MRCAMWRARHGCGSPPKFRCTYFCSQSYVYRRWRDVFKTSQKGFACTHFEVHTPNDSPTGDDTLCPDFKFLSITCNKCLEILWKDAARVRSFWDRCHTSLHVLYIYIYTIFCVFLSIPLCSQASFVLPWPPSVPMQACGSARSIRHRVCRMPGLVGNERKGIREGEGEGERNKYEQLLDRETKWEQLTDV